MSENERLTGGCLCGSVRYEASGPWLDFLHCHCERCRRATGTGHATNLLAHPDALVWATDDEPIRRYDLPTARSFANAFCIKCGAPVPHLTRDGSTWVIPAGSLDASPAMAPTARICWASRAPWSCDGDALQRECGDIP